MWLWNAKSDSIIIVRVTSRTRLARILLSNKAFGGISLKIKWWSSDSCNALPRLRSLTEWLMAAMTDQATIPLSIHSASPCSIVPLPFNTSQLQTSCRLKLFSSGSHQFSSASLFYRLFFIQTRGVGVAKWFRVRLHGGWKRIKRNFLFWGGLNCVVFWFPSGTSMQFIGKKSDNLPLFLQHVCVYLLFGDAALCSEPFSSFFPAVMSVTCGGLLWDGLTSVIAKNH